MRYDQRQCSLKQRRGAHRKALAVLGLVADVDQEGDDGGVLGHEADDICTAGLLRFGIYTEGDYVLMVRL